MDYMVRTCASLDSLLGLSTHGRDSPSMWVCRLNLVNERIFGRPTREKANHIPSNNQTCQRSHATKACHIQVLGPQFWMQTVCKRCLAPPSCYPNFYSECVGGKRDRMRIKQTLKLTQRKLNRFVTAHKHLGQLKDAVAPDHRCGKKVRTHIGRPELRSTTHSSLIARAFSN